MKRILYIIKTHYPLIIFLFIYATIVAYKLISQPTPFYDWDESLYVQTGKEMLAQRFFLFPLWQGQIWFDKPPLIPLLYATVSRLAFFTTPEISTRVFTLFVTIGTLLLIYKLYFKVLKNTYATTLVVLLTSLTPIFLQRTQVVNLDVFLFIGWVGYCLFFRNFWIGVLFLLIGTLSKSLIGFYPVVLIGVFHIYLFIIKQIKKGEFLTILRRIALQVSIPLLWFVLMLVIYQKDFFIHHIVESHFRRVSSSIEFHFGTRTYYLELIRDQFGILIWLSCASLAWIIWAHKKRKLGQWQILYALFLLPWFVFLNLTKTKIFWYIYPVIPQTAFLVVASLQWLSRQKKWYYFALAALFTAVIYIAVIKENRLKIQYSSPTADHYRLALYGKNHCNSLSILLDQQTREAFATLDQMGLLIATTKWWGSHPSIVYYFEKPVEFFYEEESLNQHAFSVNDCIAVDTKEMDVVQRDDMIPLETFGSLYLVKKYL